MDVENKSGAKNLEIEIDAPSRIFCHNKSAISVAHNSVQHVHVKHIAIDWHFVKETLGTNTNCTPYAESNEQ